MPDRLRQTAKRLFHLGDHLLRPAPGLVVLAYHRVGRTSSVEVDLPTAVFEQQMAQLAQRGRTLTLDEAVRRLAAGDDLDGAVVVTFDDGTADFADVVLPILDCYQVPATLYLATAHTDEGRPFPDDGVPLSWTALRDCAATGLVDVGSHTHTHTLMDRIDVREAATELDRSIDRIGTELGTTATHFAYPKAVAPTAEVAALVRMRFRSAALAGTRANPVGTDPHRLRRSPVQCSDGMEFFDHKLDGGMRLEDDLRRLVNRRRYADLVR